MKPVFKRIAKHPDEIPFTLYKAHRATCEECIAATAEARMANCADGKRLHANALDVELRKLQHS